MVTTEESTSVMDAVRSSSKARFKLTSAKKTVDPGMSLLYTNSGTHTHTHIHTLHVYYVMVTTEESTSVMDAVRSSSKTRSSKLTSAKKTVDPGMLLSYTNSGTHTHTLHVYYVMVPTEESTGVMDAVRSSSKTRSSKLASAKSPVVTEPGKCMLFTLINHYNLASLDLLLCVHG